MHYATAATLFVLAFTLASRAGAVKGLISHWTNLLQPFFIALVFFFGLGFQQRAKAGDPFLWFHWPIFVTAVALVVLSVAEVVRAWRRRHDVPRP